MTSTSSTDSHRNQGEQSASMLMRRTLRTMGLLVGACVIFVGVLSMLAVLIASRAVSASAGPGVHAAETNESATAKKPLSI